MPIITTPLKKKKAQDDADCYIKMYVD